MKKSERQYRTTLHHIDNDRYWSISGKLLAFILGIILITSVIA